MFPHTHRVESDQRKRQGLGVAPAPGVVGCYAYEDRETRALNTLALGLCLGLVLGVVLNSIVLGLCLGLVFDAALRYRHKASAA